MQNFMTMAREILHLLSNKHTQVLPVEHSVARCTEKSVLIRIFDTIRIFIRKSVNGTEILR